MLSVLKVATFILSLSSMAVLAGGDGSAKSKSDYKPRPAPTQTINRKLMYDGSECREPCRGERGEFHHKYNRWVKAEKLNSHQYKIYYPVYKLVTETRRERRIARVLQCELVPLVDCYGCYIYDHCGRQVVEEVQRLVDVSRVEVVNVDVCKRMPYYASALVKARNSNELNAQNLRDIYKLTAQ